jgi:fucose 4-O-acetylase-like acetyltransferase
MKQRDYFFDNAKFILIILVVFGHFLTSFIHKNDFIFSLYQVIYTFHMPAFILISGYFAKGYNKKGYIKKTAKKLILPYLCFQLIYSIVYYYLNHEPELMFDPLDPHWSLWFLLSLFFWNLMLPVFARFRPVYSIIGSLLIALLIGYVDFINNYLSLSRTFVFFPIFLIGYYLKKEYFYSLLTFKYKLLACSIFILLFIGFYLFPNLESQWLLGSKPYAEMGINSFTAMLIRLGVYILSFIMMGSFFTLVPKKRYFFTNLGKNSLYVYLLHGFIIRWFRVSEVKSFFTDFESILLLLIISLLLTLLLSSKTVTSLTQPIIEMKVSRTKEFISKLIIYVKFYWKKAVSH